MNKQKLTLCTGEKKVSMKLYNLCLDDKDNKQEITICQYGGWGRGGTTELQILESVGYPVRM